MLEQEKLLRKSKSFLSDAKTGLRTDMSLETVQNRIYYSMFSAAKAGLLSNDVEAGTHNKVNRQVGKIFVKEEQILTPEEGSFYSRQQTLRERADYDPETSFNKEEIEDALEKAKEFINKMEEVVKTE